MTHDPLDVLRAGDLPAPPDPEFAARLRARLESAMSLPEGVEMSGTAEAIAGLTDRESAPPRSAALPYLAVAGARSAIAWYADALGAVLVGEPVV
ncbi:MAG: glyoxalase, partial [Mycobacterium sp.]